MASPGAAAPRVRGIAGPPAVAEAAAAADTARPGVAPGERRRAESEAAVGVAVSNDRGAAARTERDRTGPRSPHADAAPGARRCGLRKDRGRCAGCDPGRAARSTSRAHGADRAARRTA